LRSAGAACWEGCMIGMLGWRHAGRRHAWRWLSKMHLCWRRHVEQEKLNQDIEAESGMLWCSMLKDRMLEDSMLCEVACRGQAAFGDCLCPNWPVSASCLSCLYILLSLSIFMNFSL
jgi:hypothetical protein